MGEKIGDLEHPERFWFVEKWQPDVNAPGTTAGTWLQLPLGFRTREEALINLQRMRRPGRHLRLIESVILSEEIFPAEESPSAVA